MLFFELLYLLSATMLAAYGFNSILHCWLFWRMQKKVPPHIKQLPPQLKSHPLVTVQLPIYNERHVASRLVEAVLALDWPSDRLQIQVLDDSNDDTTQIVAATIARHWETVVDVQHIRRDDRIGYKAGALEHGMQSATGEFIAIFDADFIPSREFLQNTVPAFMDPTVGCVQARWGHVNPETSLLTEAQALGIDGHFLIEQFVRDKIGAFLNFNGTAGVWRRYCMEEVGGWEHDTLTEDLDLSYRAQLGGWRIAYQVETAVPAELPVQVDAFKRQQFRWAKGSLQTAIKLLGRLWQSDEPRWRKALGTLHLTNYLVHPFMVMNLLLLLPISSSQSPVLHIAPFLTTAAIGPPLMYWLAMRSSPESLWQKLRRLIILMALGTGLSVNNTKAAFEAFTGIASEFKRTPKFAIGDTEAGSETRAFKALPTETLSAGEPEQARIADPLMSKKPVQIAQADPKWHESSYALPRNPMVWVELALAIFAVYLFYYCLQIGVWWILFWIFMYAVGYGYIVAVAFYQSWQVQGAKASLQVEDVPY